METVIKWEWEYNNGGSRTLGNLKSLPYGANVNFIRDTYLAHGFVALSLVLFINDEIGYSCDVIVDRGRDCFAIVSPHYSIPQAAIDQLHAWVDSN